MQTHHLQQTGLAEVMGVTLDRVKSLTSGKVKNLKREESEAIINQLGIRAEWLVTGEGPMLEDGETQDQFSERMQAINRMAELVNAMPLEELTKPRLCALMTGDPAQDGPLIARALAAQAQGVDFITSQRIGGANAPVPERAVTQGDRVLLENFHAAPAQVQAGVKTTLGAFADASHVSPRKRAA